MANKLRMDLELDSKGYQQGAQEAARSTKDLKQQTEDYLKDFGSLRKQMAASKKEVQNLAGAYASLSKTEKESEFGKEMAAQLNIAIEKAAEFQDVMGDVQQAIKNASSDTQAWDALKEGMEIGKSATLAYAGAVAKLTGNEEDLTKLVKTLTMVENGFNTAIKIGNAVQKQSAIMTGIRKIQMLAAARAQELETAATVKGTIAQKAFNAVAKANPYVLLGTAAVAAATAIGGYLLANKKNEKESVEANEAIKKSVERLKDVQQNYVSTVSSEFGKLMSSYSKLKSEWNKLSNEHEKNKWIKENKKNLEELGIEIKNVGDAEAAFNKNSAAVIDSFRKRAQAAALAAQAVQLYTKSMEIEQEATERFNAIRKKAGDKATNTDFNEGRAVYDKYSGEYQYTTEGAAKVNKELFKTDPILKQLSSDYENINKLIDTNITKQEKLASSVKKVGDEVKETKSDSESDKGNMPILPQLAKDFDKKLKELVKKTNAEAQEAFDKTKKPLDVYLDLQFKSPQNIQQAYNKIEKAQQVPVELDFEIPKNMSEEISKQQNSLDALVDALVVAETEKIKFANAGDTAGVTAMTEQIERLSKAYDENSEKLETNLEKAKRISEISKGFEQAGAAVGAFGDMFSALGAATDDAGLKVMGIIAQAIATITLSFAQALTSCKTWIDWLIFGVTGMTTMITMIAQIKQLTAGSYAQGGIIPGSSYHGDRLIASVNSGEMILNTQQQNRLLDMANGIVSPANGNYIVNVQGKIKGTDIVLVSRNTNKLLSKSGTNISF